jgi:hypothetical protein
VKVVVCGHAAVVETAMNARELREWTEWVRDAGDEREQALKGDQQADKP